MRRIMDKRGFRAYLLERKLREEQLNSFVSLVERFEGFLNEAGRSGALDSATADQVNAFSAALIAEGDNTWDHYIALLRYAAFAKNRPFFVSVMEYLDGQEALGNLHRKVGEALGEAKRDEIFEGVDLPPLGTPNTEKPRLTQTVVGRLEKADPKACKAILSSGLRDLQDASYANVKATFEEAGSVDAFLKTRREEFLAELEKHKQEGTWWYVQVITDEVIDYVRRHPEVSTGLREGNVVYEAKIPYMAKEHLAETDERMKRYYYCHCPWVRESIRTGDVEVSPTFCNCSSAFHKKKWEVIFGQPLRAEVVETVLRGNPWCRFAIHLPEEAV
jgi:hypothetical protein